tara:strand:+ start:1055 stop:1453 length:399 start_codon:yes stop_codon:yes gene_type:complete
MSDEAVPIETPTRFARYTVADGAGIAIGTMLKLTDPNTAVAHSGDGDAFAGIAWEEKTASDGITEITAALNGVWDLTDGGATFDAGELVALDGTANEVRLAVEADIITGSVVGKSLEDAGANEVVRVRVGEW